MLILAVWYFLMTAFPNEISDYRSLCAAALPVWSDDVSLFV